MKHRGQACFDINFNVTMKKYKNGYIEINIKTGLALVKWVNNEDIKTLNLTKVFEIKLFLKYKIMFQISLNWSQIQRTLKCFSF